MSKKHRHRRRYEEELELVPRNNMMPQNPPGGDDSSLMLIGLLQMIGSQFNLFGGNEQNNKQNNDENSSNNVDEEVEENIFDYVKEKLLNNYPEDEEISNNVLDDIIENDDYGVKDNTEIIIEGVRYNVRENEDEHNNTINYVNHEDENYNENEDYGIYISDTNNEDNIENIYDMKNIKNIDDTDYIESIDGLNDEYSIYSKSNAKNICNSANESCTELKYKNVTTHCKAVVLNNITLQNCSNEDIKTEVCKEPVVSKLPVIISKIKVSISIDAFVEFKEPAFKITDISNEVFLENCHLIDASNKLFIKGFIRKNITYSTVNSVTAQSIGGEIKNLEVDTPFKCSTSISFSTCPVLGERVYCKIESTEILETIQKEEIKSLKNTLPKSYIFKGLKKKIVLNLELSLVQEQNVFISE